MRIHRGHARQLVKTETLLHQFWSKVPVGGVGCWEWQGHRQDEGYGIVEVSDTPRLAHRVSFWLSGHSIDGVCVLHRCDNPPCVRPSHLFAGTRQDNAADKDAKGRGVIPLGEANGMARLKRDQILEIRRLLALGLGPKAVGKKFGVKGSTIRAIRDGITWKHVEPGE